MIRIRPFLRNPVVGFSSGALVLFWALFLFPRSNKAFQGPGDPHIAALQLSWGLNRFEDVLGSWIQSRGPSAIDSLRNQLVVLDLLFPVTYALLGGALLAFVWPAGALSNWFLGAPFIACVADWAENAFLLIAIRDIPPVEHGAIPVWAVITASSFASLKFALLLSTVSLVVVGLLRSWWASSEKPRGTR